MSKTLEDIILQHSTRGMDKIQKLHPAEHCNNAVEAFLKLSKGSVFIYTGFYVVGFAETDGPLGAYFLARAMEKIGFKPVIVTDDYCKDYFYDIETIYIPINGLTKNKYNEILEAYMPVCHLSIERCGQNGEGKYINSRGVDIKEFTAPVDELFILGNKTALSIAIGDGGNEVGMGSFEEALKNKEHFTDYCVVKSDFPIIATVSNWGGYAFIAGLEKSLNIKLLPSFKDADMYLDFILTKGCVDGIKGACVKSVDGKDWAIEADILSQLKDYAKAR